jgi:hypothetical protein
MRIKRITAGMTYNEALSRRHFTAEAQVPFRYSKCRTYGEKKCTGELLNQECLFPLQAIHVIPHALLAHLLSMAGKTGPL